MSSAILSWFDSIRVNNHDSLEILLALIESKDPLVRSDAISRISDFDCSYFTDRVMNYIINTAVNDPDKACRTSAYDFMYTHPNEHFRSVLSGELKDRHTWVQRAYTYAVYSNFGEESEEFMEKISNIRDKPAMSAAALICLSYIRGEIELGVFKYLKSRDFLLKLDVVCSLYDCVKNDKRIEIRSRALREINKQLIKEKIGIMHEKLEEAKIKIESIK